MLLVCLLCTPRLLAAQAAGGESFASLSAKANAARDANRVPQAIALYKKALALRPSWPEGWWSLGTLQYDSNNYTAASNSLQRLIALQPNNGTAHVMLGLCKFELGQDQAALKLIQQGKQLGTSSDPQLRNVVVYHEAVLLRRAGRFEAAQEDLGELCHDNRQSGEVIREFGAVGLQMRDKDLPSQSSPERELLNRVGYAYCLSAQKRYDEAQQEMEAAVDLHPNAPRVHYAFGKLLLDADAIEPAVQQFQLQIQADPKDVLSRLRIASAYYKRDSAAGLPYAQEAVKLDPSLPFAHYLLGLLLLDTDDYTKAIPELEIAAKAFPDQPKIFLALSSAYSKAGRTEDAAKARATFAQLDKAEKEAAAKGQQARELTAETATSPGKSAGNNPQ